MNEVLIDGAEELTRCCNHLAQCKRFGLDTEFVGEESYHPRLCLIQVATAETLYLIDPFALDSLEPFWNQVVDPNNQVIVHAGREEAARTRLAEAGERRVREQFDMQGGIAQLAVLFGLPRQQQAAPALAAE